MGVCSILLIIFVNYYLVYTSAQPTFREDFCSGGNYTNSSTYQTNLNFLLSNSLPLFNREGTNNNYRSSSIGSGSDTVHGSCQCRGDLTMNECQVCFDAATRDVIQKIRCPYSKQAIIWYDECVFRYSDESYYSILEDEPVFYMINRSTVTTGTGEFDKILAGLMNNLVNDLGSSSINNFAVGKAKFTASTQIYGLVQCAPDIVPSDCNKCLGRIVGNLSTCCDMQTAKRKNSQKVAIIIVVPSIIVVLSAIALWYLCSRRTTKETERIDEIYGIQSVESFRFHISTIRAATNNFSNANKLGEGGFGSVYKGTLADAQEIAVKRLSRKSGQGEAEFKNEVVLLVRLQHKNLVRLLGFCLDAEERLLIYNFMPNSSLDRIIFDSVKRTCLDWGKRYNIIGGIARGVLYLHEDSRLKIIHRDLKASNILLDVDMNPKVSDFGMARLFAVDQTQAMTTRIVGTYGYMAPEYAMHGQFSDKSDVFSFGVLVLEILSGKKNNSFNESEVSGDLVSHAWRHWKKGTALDLLDSVLKDSYSESEVMRCIHIGLLCVQENAADRPTMASIVLMLNNYSTSLPVPLVPAFFVPAEEYRIIFRESKDLPSVSTSKSGDSVDEASLTELHPR
ncbi:hypothetical protein C5167_034712 [Papaver somniferum]|uniref:Cysteine-rich receptor-like protein kinase 10 n=1 Tax=Papaver somniferum TaxID=3469 RepID=A0A4Y7KDR9_PAPSO|nr:putative receptor-like protein kinase At4g00960 isoform X2 [Papaver somniferum]RZC71533.1 hypothetical protein C5167_034712 [Papaver somniferum]